MEMGIWINLLFSLFEVSKACLAVREPSRESLDQIRFWALTTCGKHYRLNLGNSVGDTRTNIPFLNWWTPNKPVVEIRLKTLGLHNMNGKIC